MGALIAGLAGWPAVAGGLIAAAVLTKPQAIFVAPAVALAVWHVRQSDRRQAVRSAAAGIGVTTLAIVAPIVAAGETTNMTRAVGTLLLGKGGLSNAFSLWWLLGHLGRVAQTTGLDAQSVVATQAELVPISAFGDFDSLVVRVLVPMLGATLVLAAIGWGMWTVRRTRDL
jgi:ABC-type Fe2+-enterobactin transport system substrate-binding protein